MSKEFICADCDRNIDKCVCMTIVYGPMTGAALANILKQIDLPYVEDSYMHYYFKEPRKCIKLTFPVTDRFMSLNEKIKLDLFEFNAFYYFRLLGNLLKCFDFNSTQKTVYQIILTDEELKNVEKIMPRYHCMKNYESMSCFL